MDAERSPEGGSQRQVYMQKKATGGQGRDLPGEIQGDSDPEVARFSEPGSPVFNHQQRSQRILKKCTWLCGNKVMA